MTDIEKIVTVLYPLIEPKLKWQIGELNLIKEVRLQEDGKLYVRIDLIADQEPQKQAFEAEVRSQLGAIGYEHVVLNLYKVHVALNGLEGVKRILLVGSGKGGVGKSTIAVNLACALQMQGHRVGMMDADIQGPSQPILLGCKQKPQVLANEMLLPLEAHGLKFISTGSLVQEEKAMAWRGQMVTGTLLQFIRNTAWGQIDYLIVDLPPGTGDVQLTLAAELKADGMIMVSMPQEVVLGDVRRSMDLVREKQIPLLGFVENMSLYHCPDCGSERELFPHSGKSLEGIELLCRLPLETSIAASGDAGKPIVLSGEGPAAQAFIGLAGRVSQSLPV